LPELFQVRPAAEKVLQQSLRLQLAFFAEDDGVNWF